MNVLLSIITYNQLNFIVTSVTIGTVCFTVLAVIFDLLSKNEVDKRWTKDQYEQKDMLNHIKEKFNLYGYVTCGRIDGKLWFIYKNGKCIGIYDSKSDTLIK